MSFHLAQINIARAKAPLDSPIMRGFVDALDEINALADASPGFVWRFQTAEGNAVGERAYDDPLVLVNFSVWASVDALKAYVYRSAHVKFIAARHQWFEKLPGPHFALWWIPAGNLPNVTEAKDRLEHLHLHGPSERAFMFHPPFPPPGKPATR